MLTRGRIALPVLWIVLLLMHFMHPVTSAQTSLVADQIVNPPEVTAAALYVIDASLGRTLYESDADVRRSPASTAKIATALVVVQQVTDLDSVVEIVASDVIAIDAGESIMELNEGDVLTIRQLLSGLLVKSGNDAALALSRYVGDQLLVDEGSVGDARERFVQEMNDVVADLQLVNTHFTDPAGLYDVEQYTTARELGTIAIVALSNPDIAEIVGQSEVAFTSLGPSPRDYLLTNTNQLLADEGVNGVKTGTVPEAGACLVASKVGPEGDLIVGIVLGSAVEFDEFGVTIEGSDQRFSDMRQLFAAMETDYQWLTTGELTNIPGLGEELAAWNVGFRPLGTVVLPTASVDTIRYRLQLLSESAQDSEVGRLVFYAGSEVIAETPLVQQ